jgi:diguanylate cyclase (GGDEF)-like protein
MNLEPSREARPEERERTAPGSRVAAMEPLAVTAAAALRVPTLIIALPVSDDEPRCVAFGGETPLALSPADELALWRSGLVELASAGRVELRDMTRNHPVDQLRAFAQLRLGSLLGAPIRSAAGEVHGAICAAYPTPTIWNDDDHALLEQFARLAATDLELRRRVHVLEARDERRDFLANHDALTGLATRAALIERLRSALERPPAPAPALREVSDDVRVPARDTLVAVFLIEVTNFATVNARFGHDVGDEVLVTLARRLRRAAGREALVARLGTNRFGALVERLPTAAEADELALRLRDAVEEPVVLGGESLALAARVGVSISATTSTLAEHLMQRADLAASSSAAVLGDVPRPREIAREPRGAGSSRPASRASVVMPDALPPDAGPETRPSAPPIEARAPTPVSESHATRGAAQLQWRAKGGPFRWVARRWRAMVSMLRNASEYAQVANGEVKLRLRTVSIAELLDELRTDMVPRTYERGLRFHRAPCPSDLRARVDPGKVRRVLRHLVSNAIKFTEPGGEIFVECDANEQALRIRVRDTGCGIHPRWLAEVFEPYVQVDASRLPRGERGLGLGLTISQRLAIAMGGALEVESEVGKGTAFTLTLLRG